MSPRVMHVTQPVEAGVAQVVLDLLADQQSAGWTVRLVSPPGWLPERAAELGIGWMRWDATREPGRSVPGELRALRKVLRSWQPDLVHLHSSKAGLVGRLALRGAVPTVFAPHAWSFAAARGRQAGAALSWERLAARWTSLQISCSGDERAQGLRRGIGGWSEVVPNAVDLTRWTVPDDGARLRARTALGLTADVPVVVCVGRISRQKGQDIAVTAWDEVRRVLPTAVLLVAGDGPEREQLQAAAGDGVRLLGPRSDVPDLLAAADLAVLPSRWEGLALAMLEAMACGRSVVATDVAGSRSTLLEGTLPVGGCVVPVDDVPALVGAVVHRLLHPDVARDEGRAGRQRVERSHDLVQMTARVRSLYADVLSS